MKDIIRKKKRQLSAFLSVLLIATAAMGCGSSGENNLTDGSNQTAKQNNNQESGEDTDHTSTAKGRYVETLNTVTEHEGWFRGLTRMEDGSLAIPDSETGKWISDDHGETWEEQPIGRIKEINDQNYIQDMVLSPLGDIAIKFTDAVEDSTPIIWKFKLVLADESEVVFGEDVKDINYFCFDNKGKLFASSGDREIYQIDRKTGKAKKVMDIEDENCYLSIYDSVLVTMNNEGIKIYNLDTQEKIEDKVLTSFFDSTIRQFDFYSGNYYSALIEQEKDNVITIVCREGLFRHVIGAGTVEKVIDGSLNSFSNPSISFLGLAGIEENKYLVLFSGALTGKYAYSAEVPTVPNQTLSVYSLLKNENLQQTVALFRQQYPDIFVKYEVGIDVGSALTREDAIKKLNTKIMAGEGPDLIMLDQLPFESYVEKGILSDLTPFFEKQEQSLMLLPGVKKTYEKEGKILAVPTKFMVPAIIGDRDTVQGIGTIRELADLVEKLRDENPDGQILGYYLPRETLTGLSAISAPDWQKEDGSIDKEALTEYLTQAKRIYEAEIAGITKEDIERYKKINDSDETGIKRNEMYAPALEVLSSFNLFTGDSLIGMGYLNGNNFSLAQISSGMEDSGRENLVMSGFDMEGKSYYVPLHVMGISASVRDQSIAEAFLSIMLGEQNQNLTFGGFPVNRKAFEQSFTNTLSKDSEERTVGAMSASARDGSDKQLTIRLPEEDWIKQCREIVESANTPDLTDDILKRTVFDLGTAALTGEKTVEESVNEIIGKLAIYMAE